MAYMSLSVMPKSTNQVWPMVATFNNISAISWQSALLVEENLEYLEKTPVRSLVTNKLYHINVRSLVTNKLYHINVLSLVTNKLYHINVLSLVTNKLYHIKSGRWSLANFIT
jgi:hypothetical protein